MIKKLFIIKLIGILAVFIPIVFYQGIAMLGLGVMRSGSLVVATAASLVIIFYLYSSVSFIRGRFNIWKLAVIMLGLTCYIGRFVMPFVSYFLSSYRQVEISDKTGNIEKLEKDLTKLVKTRKADPLIAIKIRDLGAIHYGLGKYDLALKDFSERDIYAADEFKVAIYTKLENLSAAVDGCNRLINASSYWPEKYYFLRGNVHYFFKEYKKAILDYSKAIEITKKPCEDNQSHIARANTYAKLNKPDLALADYGYVIKSYFESTDNSGMSDYERCSYLFGYFYRANFYFFLDKIEEAKKDLQYVLSKSQPWNQVTAEANILMGYIMSTEGKDDLALSYYKKAQEITDGWDGRGNQWASVRVRQTLKKLINTYITDDEEIKKFNSPLDKYTASAEEIKNKIYQDKEILEGMPRLFEYPGNQFIENKK